MAVCRGPGGFRASGRLVGSISTLAGMVPSYSLFLQGSQSPLGEGIVPVSPRDSHEIVSTIGGGTQVDDFTKGFIKGHFTNNLRMESNTRKNITLECLNRAFKLRLGSIFLENTIQTSATCVPPLDMAPSMRIPVPNCI